VQEADLRFDLRRKDPERVVCIQPATTQQSQRPSDRLMDYLPSLLEEEAIQYYSCFISYSDDAFAKRPHTDLQNTGVRCWFAPHDLAIGAKTGTRSTPPFVFATSCC
jgi:hypothetical protein